MDLQMPIVDGLEATRRLKSKPETRDMPVIGLSAPRDRVASRSSGASTSREIDTAFTPAFIFANRPTTPRGRRPAFRTPAITI